MSRYDDRIDILSADAPSPCTESWRMSWQTRVRSIMIQNKAASASSGECVGAAQPDHRFTAPEASPIVKEGLMLC